MPTKYEDVKHVTTEEYFGGNRFSIDVFNKKYTLYDGETYVQAIKRVCDYIASAEETEEQQKYWSDRWFDEIYNDWWHPAGSIMQGANCQKNVSMANCTTISLGTYRDNEEWDSLEGIIKNSSYTVAKTAACRQGLGIDFSRLRPKNTSVNNSANLSTGSIHWMKFVDSIGYYVGQKGRIPAMLFSLSCKHPDIMDFINVKRGKNAIQNANISVQCTNDFYESILNNRDWELYFQVPKRDINEKVYIDINHACIDTLYDPKPYYKSKFNRKENTVSINIKASEILEAIAKGMTEFSEPGIQNIDIARKYSNSDYVYDPDCEYDSRIVSTNACCVTYDTPILTDLGYYKIGHLIDKKCNVWNGKEFSTVIPFLAGKNIPVYRVKLSNGIYLDCTDNHVWLINENGKEEKVYTADLEEGMLLSNYNYPVIDSDNKECTYIAYQHGIFCGDGQLHHNKQKGVLLYGEKKKLAKFISDKESFNILKGDRIWVNLPEDLPPKYSVPYNSDVQYKLCWLAGLLDSDGCICRNKSGTISLQISSINYQFLNDVNLLLTTLGISGHINIMKKEGYNSLPDGNGGYKDYKCQTCYRLCVSTSNVEKLISLGLKTNRLNLVDRTQPINKREIKISITSIDYINNQDVYCFTEPKNNSGCFNGIVTGQSEQYLSRDSLCVLSSINAAKFSTDKNIFETEIEKIGYSINRFLDNVNEMELRGKTYATEFQKRAIEYLRRTGAGYTNLAAWLFKQNLEYGSKECNDAVEYFTQRYNYYLYKSSIELGKEKGNFKLFNREKLEKSPFIQRMIGLGLTFETLRNVTCSSIAPTGTLSLMFRDGVFSYGIEPAFGIYFWKRTRVSGKYEYYFCVPSIVRSTFKDLGINIPINSDTIKDTWDGKYGKPIAEFIDQKVQEFNLKFKRSTEVNPLDKLDLMAKAMKWIDSSISVTYMLPETANWQDVYNFILEAYKKEVKSIAAFPDRKMYGIVSYIPFYDLAIKLTGENVFIDPQNFTDDELDILRQFGKYYLSNSVKSIEHSRPKTLSCDVHHTTISGKSYFVLCGLKDGALYEVFCGKNGFIDKSIHTGKIIKTRGGYKGVFGEDIEVCPITSLSDDNEQAITRMVSLCIQSGTEINKIIKHLEKIPGDITSFNKALCRVLKKYVKHDTVSGKCPECGGDLIYVEGCSKCSNGSCLYSKCS